MSAQQQTNNSQYVQQQAIVNLNKQLQQLLIDNDKLKKENEQLKEFAQEAQQWKDKYESMHKQYHSTEHELKKKLEVIKNLEITIENLNEKTKELEKFKQISDRSTELQIANLELAEQLNTLQEKKQFLIRRSTKMEQGKSIYLIIVEWERNIQGLEINYKIENDLLILEGYGQLQDKFIVYSEQVAIGKKLKSQIEKPNISIKNSMMTLTFET